MSWLTLVFVLALTTGAKAEEVDWSQYIEKQPSRPLVTTTQKQAKSPRNKRVARPAKINKAKQAKAKARAKAKPRRK
jgi:hypothetical protein